jgi:hypothetical protein
MASTDESWAYGLRTLFQELLGGNVGVHGCRSNKARPSRLMRRPDASAIVTVEIFVEQKIVAPMRVGLKFFHAAEDCSASIGPPTEDSDQASRNLLAHLIEVHPYPRTGWAFDSERVTVEKIKLP